MGTSSRLFTLASGVARRAGLAAAIAVACLAGLAGAAPAAHAAPGDLIWHKTWNRTQPAAISGVRIASDGRGDIYVGATIDLGSGHGRDWMVARYTTAGKRLWVRYWNAPGHGDDLLNAMAADRYGNVTLCGEALTGGAAGYDFAVVHFARTGTLLWTKRIDGSAHSVDIANDVTVDGAGNVYVTGTIVTTAGSGDWLTLKYAPDGRRLWRRSLDGALHANDSAGALTRDAQGNLYVTGYSRITAPSGMDLTLVRYSSGGHVDWKYDHGFNAGWDDQGIDVAVNGGLVAVTGIDTMGADMNGTLVLVSRYGIQQQAIYEGVAAPPDELYGFDRVAIDAVGNVLVGGFRQAASATGPDYYRGYFPAFAPYTYYADDGTAHGWDQCSDVVGTPQGIFYCTGTVRNSGTADNVYTVAIGPGWFNRFSVPYIGAGSSNDQGHALVLYGGGLYVAGVSGGDLLLLKYEP